MFMSILLSGENDKPRDRHGADELRAGDSASGVGHLAILKLNAERASSAGAVQNCRLQLGERARAHAVD